MESNRAFTSDKTSADSLLRLVKANDLTDEQINRLWVPFGPSPDRLPFFDPASPMATVILGGKGSGKTHLLRYHSFAVQALKYQQSPLGLAAITKSRYIAVYTKASGLNGSRFKGKTIPQEAWTDAFAYYTELWLAQGFLDVIVRLSAEIADLRSLEPSIVRACKSCFDKRVGVCEDSFASLATQLRLLQQALDRGINEASFTGSFYPDIRCSRGKLLFGFPRIVQEQVASFRDIVISYYMDEYENFDVHQQRYFNTLLREREAPTTIRIGARMYGMSTFATLSASEDIRDGSEYELLSLDSRFREDQSHYNVFARDLLLRRIQDWAGPSAIQELDQCFGSPTPKPRADGLPTLIEKPTASRPHLTRLCKRLQTIVSREYAESIVQSLKCEESGLVEKATTYLFYQGYARGEEDLLSLARRVASHRASSSGEVDNQVNRVLEHFRSDFAAQLSREARQPGPVVTDLDSLILMSEGLPRVFLTTMKHIFSWSEFEIGKLTTDSVSTRARRRGLLDAAEWFQRDMPQSGADGQVILSCVARLGELFRINRYADKPIECSLIAFSIPVAGLSQTAASTIQECENRSFIIRVRRGERDRNSREVRPKYHLNRVLCPLFGLPVGRRGTARLDAWEVEAIFGITREDDYMALKRRWNRRVNWPFGRVSNSYEWDDSHGQMRFPGVE